MKILKLFVIIVLPFAIWQCSTYKSIKIDSKSTAKNRVGVVYSLPKTAIKVNVTIVKEIKVKGPFAEFAEKLLGLKNVIAFNQTGYRVSNISIEPVNIPDSSEQYMISKKRCFLKKHHDNFELNSLGEITSLNTRGNEDKINSIPSKSINLANANINYPNFFQLYADASQIEKIDTVYETVRTDTVLMSMPIIKRTLVTKTVEQRAVEAADYILKFRMKRYELISASQEVTYTKDAIEYMNNQLLKMESEYMELFMGISQFETQQVSFVVVPNAANKNETIALFGFSDVNGILDAKEQSSFKYSLTIESNSTRETDTVPFKRLTQIPYRTPELVNVYINVNNERLPQFFQIPIHQYGVKRYFPKNIKSFKIDPTSGLVTKIRVK